MCWPKWQKNDKPELRQDALRRRRVILAWQPFRPTESNYV